MDRKYTAYRKRSMVLRYRWKEEVLAFGALLAFGFLINASIEIKSQCLDDLHAWYWFAHESFMDYVFPVGGDRFRFIYNFVAYLEYFFVGNHANWFVPINITLNSVIAYTIYRMARRLADNGPVGFLCAALYLLSRMSYYQISQVMGIMESLALWTAITILYFLYQYLNEKENADACFYAACGLYFVNCFIHERYMVLMPLFLLVLLMRKEKSPVKWGVLVAVFLLVQLIRFLAIGTLFPAGTDGTYVKDTFSARQTLTFIGRQVLHLFGVNLGDEWLCPPVWDRTARWVKAAVIAEDAVILAAVLLFVIKIVREPKKYASCLKNAALFIFFIGFCILCSSVTVRVEIRWVYVSMTGALLFLAYMCGVISHREEPVQAHFEREAVRHHRALVVSVGLVSVYSLLSFLTETYYRGYYSDLYYWGCQQQYNSLAEETWERYGEEMFGKRIYILKNSYEVNDFYANAFLEFFDRNKEANRTQIYFVDDIRDFGQVTQNMLVLREDPDRLAYQDITDMVREMKCEPIAGYYSDGWMDEHARVRVMAGSTGEIELELLYPGAMTGKETMKIRMDGGPAETVKIDQNILYVTLRTVPYRTVELEFENNFYLDTEEFLQQQRGEDRFSLIVNIKAD